MATTITQARPLLTAAELELFDQSRAEPIKALTLARLRGKVTRARTLRDKYRDLFRRQTVAVRSAPTTKGRSPVGADNERTQRKADVLQEVLGRFEARVAQLEAKEAKGLSETAPKTKRKAAAPAKKTAAVKAGAKTGEKSVAKAGAKPESADAGARKRAPAKKAAKTAAAPVSARTRADDSAVTESLPVAGAMVQPARSLKAPSDKAPAANGKAHAPQVNAPIDLLPAALRVNPLKQTAATMAIHAHQGGSARRSQGKRDSR